MGAIVPVLGFSKNDFGRHLPILLCCGDGIAQVEHMPDNLFFWKMTFSEPSIISLCYLGSSDSTHAFKNIIYRCYNCHKEECVSGLFDGPQPPRGRIARALDKGHQTAESCGAGRHGGCARGT
jgi:hypothetical protein